MNLPQLYPILDADTLSTSVTLYSHAVALAEAGCTVLQYRAKHLDVRRLLAHARELRRLLPNVTLVMNDRADLCLAAGFDGVHIGQDDLTPQSARLVVGAQRIVGLSTHNAQQFARALEEPVDYLAIGPIFNTSSKQNPDPVVGLSGITEARRLLDTSGKTLPLVAIGGITRANAQAVIKAGASAVAVIGDISGSPHESAREFFRLMM